VVDVAGGRGLCLCSLGTCACQSSHPSFYGCFWSFLGRSDLSGGGALLHFEGQQFSGAGGSQMEDLVDYSFDGVEEGAIFSGGLMTPGKGALVEEGGAFQAGKGFGEVGGASGGPGSDGTMFNFPKNPNIEMPTSSMGLEGLDAELEFFRSSEGLGAGPLFSGSLGFSLPPVGKASSFLGLGSLPITAGFSGDFFRQSAGADGAGSFSVGNLIGSEGLSAFPGAGVVGPDFQRTSLAAGDRDGASQGSGGPLLEAVSLPTPRHGGKGKGEVVSKPSKAVKHRHRQDQLVLGLDVSMGEAVDLSRLAVVGRARGKAFSPRFLRKWAAKHWAGLVEQPPGVRVLTKGWCAFTFLQEKEVEAVIGRPWEICGVPVLFKRWTPFFDSKLERVDKELLWVRLPGLPMNLWNEPRFAEIGNYLGEYVCSDQSFQDSGYYTVARILVKIDLKLGLSSEIPMKSPDGVFTQVLDYEGVPFRCHRCHAYGHMVASCPLPPRDSIKRIDDYPEEGLGVDVEEHRAAEDGIEGVEGGEAPVQEVVVEVGTQVDRGKEQSGCSKPPSEPVLVDKISVGQSLGSQEGDLHRLGPQTRAFTRSLQQQVVALRGTPSTTSGMSLSFQPSPTIPLCSAFVTGEGGVGSVGMPLVPVGPVASCNMPPSESIFTPSLVSTNLSTSSESRSIRYALRTREIEHSGGRGLAEVSRCGGGRGRGRKSLFTKAQERAHADVVLGTQSSIEWALRAVKAQGGVVQ